MNMARQALAVARIEAGQGTPEQKARVIAWDRLHDRLSTLDSKTSVLLRFNAIVVAALAYLLIVRASDPFAEANAVIKLLGSIIGHVSLLASVLSCGFAFPVSTSNGSFSAAGWTVWRAARPTSTMPPCNGWATWVRGAPGSIGGLGSSPWRADRL
jgi:hypothetical protein